MKSKKINLRECSDGEMVNFLTQAVVGSPETTEITVYAENPESKKIFKTRMSQYIGMLRGMHLWYHAAHHATRGAGFSGDHPNLYGSFYNALGEEVDGAIEKAIGLSNDEEFSCPKCITSLALQVLDKYPSPATIRSLAIASCALQIEKDYARLVDALFRELESAGCLSMGLNDFLMGSVNDHEGHIYKLQQRIKSELED